MSTPMRRSEREITNPADIEKVLAESHVCRIALYDAAGGYPYIVPLSYGYEYDAATGSLALYFHGAKEGRKLELIRQNEGKAGFEIDESGKPEEAPEACRWSIAYQSIIGVGKITELSDATDRKHGLDVIMRCHGRTSDFEYNEESLNRVAVLKLVAERFTGKRH